MKVPRSSPSLTSALVFSLAASLVVMAGASPANAAATCTFRPEFARVKIVIPTDNETVSLTRDEVGDLRWANAPDALTYCVDPSGQERASVTNVDTIKVVGAEGKQTLVLDLDSGLFAPGQENEPGPSDEIEIVVNLQEGHDDELIVLGRPARDRIRFGLAGINLNAGEGSTVDADITFRGVERFFAHGQLSADKISGEGGVGTGDPFAVPLFFFGGAGADILTGGEGFDFLDGGPTGAGDELYGGEGFDHLDGGPTGAGDELYGGEGDDSLFGGEGDDLAVGGPGADFISGDQGDDHLDSQDGIEGNDSIDADGGTDTCVTDPGDYTIGCD